MNSRGMGWRNGKVLVLRNDILAQVVVKNGEFGEVILI